MSKLSYNSDNMTSDELRNTLERLGLSGHEPAVYGALLERSPAGATWIAKRCGLSRSSVYATLAVLVGRGLVGVTHEQDVKQFTTGGATALLEALRSQQREATARVERASQLVDALARIGSVGENEPQVIHFEGAEGLRRIYLAMLRFARMHGARGSSATKSNTNSRLASWSTALPRSGVTRATMRPARSSSGATSHSRSPASASTSSATRLRSSPSTRTT